MQLVRVPTSLINDRLDARYNSPDAVRIRQKLRDCGIKNQPLSGLFQNLVCGPFGSTLTADMHREDGEVLLVQPTNISEDLFTTSSSWRIREATRREINLPLYPASSFLFARVGIYPHVGVLPEWAGPATISSSMVAGLPNGAVDHHFLYAFFRSHFGEPLLFAAQKITAQPTIGTYEIGITEVITPAPHAQAYIGDKVRQGERLRARARELEGESSELSSVPHVTEATQSSDPRTNRVPPSDMWPRLDSKYYGARSLATLKATQVDGTRISDFVINVSNGFEERSFVKVGKPYITVTEVSSGRLDADNAPQIDTAVSIPPKAIIHERCVLVVRTGSIGTAVKVFQEDAGMAISSHLIRLEFEDEKTAACTAAFLNSPAGKILQHKISYGAVQPQIGQEELLALSVPQQFIDQAENLLRNENARESAIRFSARLTTAAKLLVEALIEGQVSEADLVAAQKALEANDRSADRAILQRLTRKGMDAANEPALFPDLDALYDALDALDGREGVEE